MTCTTVSLGARDYTMGVLGFAASAALAIIGESYGQPILGWFVGGFMGALTAQLVFAPRTRSIPVKVVIALVLGVVIVVVKYLITKYWS